MDLDSHERLNEMLVVEDRQPPGVTQTWGLQCHRCYQPDQSNTPLVSVIDLDFEQTATHLHHHITSHIYYLKVLFRAETKIDPECSFNYLNKSRSSEDQLRLL